MNPAEAPLRPELEYSQRLADRKARAARETARQERLGNVRLGFTAGAIAGIWFAASAGFSGWPVLAAAALAVLIALFVAGDRLTRRMHLAQRAVTYYERALDRVRQRRNLTGETGARFQDPQHPYASDLDLFGTHSLFQLLSTCRTRAGENLLAAWLLAPADAPEIASRHDALADLRCRLNLREDLAVLGEDFGSGVHPEALAAWAIATPIAIPRSIRYLAVLFSAAGLTALAGWTLTGFSDPRLRLTIVAIGLLEAAVFFRWRGAVQAIAHAAEEPGHDLALLAAVLERLEREEFAASRLTQHARSLRDPLRASQAISQLRRLMELLESRETWFVRIFGPLILWTTQVSFALEDWRQRHGSAIPGWLTALADCEALGSLAASHFEQPDDVLPDVGASEPLFAATGLAHPLLRDCVPNDIRLDRDSRLLIVSGSNMSGKSTLLRAVGLNAVLALAGAPVRASSLQIAPLWVGASIRASDSLEGGVSRFYSEILRIRQILDLPAPLLFLLDELLAGTNSHDRGIGAEAIFRGLLERGALGLATTHDLALAAFAERANAVVNVHFEDFIQDGRIHFDYRMRAGIVTRSNALELMRSVGLKV